MNTLSFKVEGLDCAEEIAILKREVGPVVGGEERLSFHVLNAKMTVECGDDVPSEAICAAVAQTGMKAVPWETYEEGQRGGEGAPGFWTRRGRTMMCALSGAFLCVGYLSHAYAGGWFGALTSEGGYPLGAKILYSLAAVSGAWFIAPKALYAARRLRPDMNLLMFVAAGGAILIGEWFEAGTVAFLFSLALLLESWSVGRARRAIESLMDLSPATARYICPHDGDVVQKPIDEVPMGATVLTRPGEKIPLDGTVSKGTTTVNQSTITGESLPVSKGPGDTVYAGTLNNDGAFEFTVTKAANDTTLARIIHLVEEAETRRAPIEQWVDRFARVYTPAMMIIALLIAVVPPIVFGAAWLDWVYQALVILVIACPCALVISTPVSIIAGMTSAARAGVLIKGGVFLELPAKLRAIAIDKTGTLTFGSPTVQEIVPLNGHTAAELLERAAALEANSEHPLAKAVLARAERDGVSYVPAEGYQAIQGKGAMAQVNNRSFWIGSHRLLHEMGGETEECHERANLLEDAGHSVLAVGNDNHVCGLISVADDLRPGTRAAIKRLEKAGIEKIVMLTGDNEGTAKAVAADLGIEDYRSELLPEDKMAAVRELVETYEYVAMVGDGVNDAPAMASATMGIAMGAVGADAAIETADIALMSDDLAKIPWVIEHSKRTVGIIKQNIIFALGLKAVFIVLALMGLATLWMAIAADMGASLLVIFNGLRLLDAPE